MKSVIQDSKKCWFCGRTSYLHDHHIFFGPNRKNSEKYGMKVWLCVRHHTVEQTGVHHNRVMDLRLKRIAQSKFEEIHGHDKYMEVFGKNYLED